MPHESVAEHYAQLIGLGRPWQVSRVEVSHADQEVRIFVVRATRPRPRCPECDRPCAGYDTRERRWRHLDTMQYRTFVIAEVPRVRCEKHGIRQVEVPWSDPGSRFTALFEALVIDWLREANVRAIARRLRLSWDQVAGVQARAVKRGLARRESKPPTQIGVDETSFQKRHEYVTVVHDIDREVVVHVADDRKQEALESYFEDLGPEACAALERIAMDMWAPYIAATRAQVPDADAKIVFDKFHIAKHLAGEGLL